MNLIIDLNLVIPSFRHHNGNKYIWEHKHMADSLQWKHITITVNVHKWCWTTTTKENMVRAERIGNWTEKTTVKTVDNGADEHPFSEAEWFTYSNILSGDATKWMGNDPFVHWYHARYVDIEPRGWTLTTTADEVSSNEIKSLSSNFLLNECISIQFLGMI